MRKERNSCLYQQDILRILWISTIAASNVRIQDIQMKEWYARAAVSAQKRLTDGFRKQETVN